MSGQEPGDGQEARNRFAAVYRVLDEAIAARAFPGCAFGVLAGGKTVLADARGRFTYDSGSAPVAPATLFDIASVSKVVATTAAVMLLVQRRQLHVDDRLIDWLPGFAAGRAEDDPARNIRLRHLLAHSSGLPGYVEFFRTCATPESLLRACLQLPLESAPGTRAEYSDPGFILLGSVLERCVGERMDRWVEREIFVPLQLAATGFCPPPELRATISPTEEDTTFRKRRIQGEVQDENAFVLGGVAGHAGLFSNVADLLRFSAEILRAKTAGEPDPAPPGLFSRDTMVTFAQRQGPAGSSCALGWDTPSENSSSGKHFSSATIGHLGYSGCSLWIDLDAEVAVALLTNCTWPDRANRLIKQVRPVFHDAVREAL